MNEMILINYDSDRPTVLGRDLHEALGIKSKYADWFKNMCAYGFEEGKDYVSFSKILENGGRTKDHQITIPMAKEICMIQRSDLGKQCRQYFLKIEEQWNSPEAIMSRALQMANRKLDDLKKVNLTLTAKIEEDKPKVIFAEAVETAKTSILVGELAKILKQNGVATGQKRFFEWLRENGYLIKSGSDKNMPTQRSMEMGLFEIKETAVAHSDGHTTVSKTPKVTGKGQQYFINKLIPKEENKENAE
ncbi:MAG: phage antirepressor KilAC domain-containing protein [Clostridia bacterium]|nr:phage antirepressor KilAC domain-containing protein [Clostridia bacterium]